MPRRRVVIPIVLIAVVALVSLALLRSEPGGGTPTPVATSVPEATAPEAASQTWQIVGAIDAMSGQFWSIAGTAVRITDSTRIESDAPITIGTIVHVTGLVAADGTRIATGVLAGAALASATASANPATDTPSSVLAVSPSPSPTAGFRIELPLIAVRSGLTGAPPPQSALRATLDGLKGLRTTVKSKPDSDRLDQAIQHLNASLAPTLWVDSTHLQRRTGDKVFTENKATVNQLRQMLSEQKAASLLLVLQGFVDQIRDADRALATVAFAEAMQSSASRAVDDRAAAELTKGDADAALGHSDSAIDHYHNAWHEATTPG
jgi:hypothetical protein